MSKENMGVNPDADVIRKHELEYVLHPWVLQKGLNPMVVERAKGTTSMTPQASNTWISPLSLFSATWAMEMNGW